VPHVTNISLSFESKTLPRPRCTAAPVAVAPWARAFVGVAVSRSASMPAVCAGARPLGTGVVPAGAGTVPVAGSRLTMPTQQIVLTPITRKHNVYLARVNAGGDGASGPYPEREPA
jgi:hypothetical protein